MKNVDILYSIVGGDRPPTLPLREERRTDGVELVYNAKGIGDTIVSREADRREALLLKKLCLMEKRFQRNPPNGESKEEVMKALSKVNNLKAQVELGCASGISYSMYLDELKKLNQNQAEVVKDRHLTTTCEQNFESTKSTTASLQSKHSSIRHDTARNDSNFNNDNIDVVYSVVGDQKPPSFPLREEMLTEGIELVYKKPRRMRDAAPLKSREQRGMLPHYRYPKDPIGLRNRRIKTASSRSSRFSKTEIMMDALLTVNSSLTEDTYVREFRFGNYVQPSTYSRNGCFYYPPIKKIPFESSSQWSVANDSLMSRKVQIHHGYRCEEEDSIENLQTACTRLHCSLDQFIDKEDTAPNRGNGFNDNQQKIADQEIKPLPSVQSFDFSKCRYDYEDCVDKYGIDYLDQNSIASEKVEVGNESKITESPTLVCDDRSKDCRLSEASTSKDNIYNGIDTERNVITTSATLSENASDQHLDNMNIREKREYWQYEKTKEHKTIFVADYDHSLETKIAEVAENPIETESTDITNWPCNFSENEREVEEYGVKIEDDQEAETETNFVEDECKTAETVSKNHFMQTLNDGEEWKRKDVIEDVPGSVTNIVKYQHQLLETTNVDVLRSQESVPQEEESKHEDFVDSKSETSLLQHEHDLSVNLSSSSSKSKQNEEEQPKHEDNIRPVIMEDAYECTERRGTHSVNLLQYGEEQTYRDIVDDDEDPNIIEDCHEVVESGKVDLLCPSYNSMKNGEEVEEDQKETIEDSCATETNVVKDESKFSKTFDTDPDCSFNSVQNGGHEDVVLEYGHGPETSFVNGENKVVQTAGTDNCHHPCKSSEEEEYKDIINERCAIGSNGVKDEEKLIETKNMNIPGSVQDDKDIHGKSIKDSQATSIYFVENQDKKAGNKTLETFSDLIHFSEGIIFDIPGVHDGHNDSRTTSYTSTTYDSTQSFDTSNNDASREDDDVNDGGDADQKSEALCIERSINNAVSEMTNSVQSFELSTNSRSLESSKIESAVSSKNSVSEDYEQQSIKSNSRINDDTNESIDPSNNGTTEEGEINVDNSSGGSADTIPVDNTNRSKALNAVSNLKEAQNFDSFQDPEWRKSHFENSESLESINNGPKEVTRSMNEDIGAVMKVRDENASRDNIKQSKYSDEPSIVRSRTSKENVLCGRNALPPIRVPTPELVNNQLQSNRKIIVEHKNLISNMRLMRESSPMRGPTLTKSLDDATTERRSQSVPNCIRGKMSSIRYRNNKSRKRYANSVSRRDTDKNKAHLPRANFGVSVFATSACRPFA